MVKKIASVLFATFSARANNKRTPINGMIEPMISFFTPKVQRFILLEQPHPGSDTVIPLLEIYENGKLTKKSHPFITSRLLSPLLTITNISGTQVIFKIRDFFSVLEFAFKDRQKKYDLFIGLESINTIAGILLKKIGFAKTVVYYVSDYSPSRYKIAWFNKLYLFLDKFACEHSDFIWDVSKAMMPARIKVGLKPKKSAPAIQVPNALFPNQISYLPASKIERHSLVFAGTLGQENGPDLAIEALKIVTTKLPKTVLHIYGGGNSDLERLKNLAKKLNLEKHVVFHGFISNQTKLSNEIRKYAVGLAPYKAIKGSPRWWADATKIRLYLAAGLPVITTQVPPLGKEIEKDKAGIVAKDNTKNQASAIIKILKNRKIYNNMRKAAIKKAKHNTWENTYSQALEKMYSNPKSL